MRAYRFEMDPNNRQSTVLARACGLSRKVYNWGLSQRQADYETRVKPARERGEKVRGLTKIDQINEWNRVKRTVAPYWTDFPTRIPEYALEDVDRAYANFFAGLKSRRRVGFPRFKKRGGHESFRVRGAIKVSERTITFPRLGSLRVKGNAHRVAGAIKQATISRRAGHWFVSILVEQEHTVLVTSGPVVGIDAGLKTTLTLSTGAQIQAPKPLLRSLRKLRSANKALSRSQRNSNRRKETKARLARVHLRVANQRGNWLHETSNRLTREFGTIVVEDLSIAGMSNKKRHTGRSWADLGIGELYRQIAYKSAWRGKTLVRAPRFYPSSQLCSGCGARQPMPLDVRTYDCPACGLSLDRDLNAAINLASLAGMSPESLNGRGEDTSRGSAARTSPKRQPSTDQAVAA